MQDRWIRVKMLFKQQGIFRTLLGYILKKIKYKKSLKMILEFHIYPETVLNKQRKTVFNYRPCISIVTPLYNTPIIYLKELIESVRNQTYSNWELCFVDGSDDEHNQVQACCESYVCMDGRIKYKKLQNNYGIVGNTNECIKITSGEYIGLLDHDDLLHPSALYEVIEAIQKEADFIYTDEMKFRSDITKSTDIVCKSGFGKDELRSHNYICHFVVFKRQLLNGMDELYNSLCEGSQDYDMVLRLTEIAKNIVHIPKILYYWRVHQGSVSMDLSVKQYAVDAAKRAISMQLERQKELGRVESNLPYQTIYRINYETLYDKEVAIVLWGCRDEERLIRIIKRILKNTSYRPLQIITSSSLLEYFQEEKNVSFLCVKNVSKNIYEWFNSIIKACSAEYMVYMNGSCVPETQSWIEELLMYAQRKDVFAVSPQINFKKNKVYFGGAVLDKDSKTRLHILNYKRHKNSEGYEANMKHVRNVTITALECMMISRSKLIEFSGFDTNMGNYSVVDLCLKGRRNKYWNVWTCFAQVYYEGKDSIYSKVTYNKRFNQLWGNVIEMDDEYYHPFLKKTRKV